MKVNQRRKLYIVGTHGVPARYGGFETLADHLCQHLNEDFDITVYCNAKKYTEHNTEYHGANLKYINLNASGFSGIFYDLITFPIAAIKADVILFLGVTGAGFIVPCAKFFRVKVIVNQGGLKEWEREKLSWLQKKWAKFNHKVSARYSDQNIVDNELYGICLRNDFNAESTVIRYGGDHVKKIDTAGFINKHSFLTSPYAVSVSRAQIDNNLHLLLECFECFNKFPLVLISNWEVSTYGQSLKAKYLGAENIILVDAIYDRDELDCIRANAAIYIHSHSRCGTAPSLVEAMCLEKPVMSFNAATNIETTENKALYFANSEELYELLVNSGQDQMHSLGAAMTRIAQKKYRWKTIADQYRKLIQLITS